MMIDNNEIVHYKRRKKPNRIGCSRSVRFRKSVAAKSVQKSEKNVQNYCSQCGAKLQP